MTKRTPPFSPEVRERAVRMVWEHPGEHDSQYGASRSIAAKIGCSGETLRNWVRQAERDQGQRAGPTTDDRERIKALEREVRELRQANAALYRVVIVRLRSHLPTLAYMQRRLAEGLTQREIIRCLKRFVAREIYAHLCGRLRASEPLANTA